MRIATWNLARARPSSRRAAALQAQMRAIDADLWVLTETWVGLAPSPEHRLVARAAAAADRDARRGEVWTAIWSRLPAEPLSSAAEPDRCAAARIAPAGHPPFLCFGSVLPWLSDGRRLPLRGAPAFLAALAEQRAGWLALRAQHPGAGLVLAGDLNQDLAPVHYYGSRAGRDALRQALAADRLACLTAGDAARPGQADATGTRRAHIDHICVSPELAGQSVGTWPAGELPANLSDHYGVWADLALPAAR